MCKLTYYPNFKSENKSYQTKNNLNFFSSYIYIFQIINKNFFINFIEISNVLNYHIFFFFTQRHYILSFFKFRFYLFRSNSNKNIMIRFVFYLYCLGNFDNHFYEIFESSPKTKCSFLINLFIFNLIIHLLYKIFQIFHL